MGVERIVRNFAWKPQRFLKKINAVRNLFASEENNADVEAYLRGWVNYNFIFMFQCADKNCEQKYVSTIFLYV